ncbi:MAG: hypothetical protein HC927_12710 [Deltaproteobacteria bacterium]|nr:hypothetical protein [Deltaproteobacteria bacterium]
MGLSFRQRQKDAAVAILSWIDRASLGWAWNLLKWAIGPAIAVASLFGPGWVVALAMVAVAVAWLSTYELATISTISTIYKELNREAAGNVQAVMKMIADRSVGNSTPSAFSAQCDANQVAFLQHIVDIVT